jgi:hypothetical protein
MMGIGIAVGESQHWEWTAVAFVAFAVTARSFSNRQLHPNWTDN